MEIWKSFTFEAAHLLPRTPAGHKCRRLHGHSYKVEIRLAGGIDESAGWILDFADVAAAWKPLHDELDHRFLNEVPGLENPTSENLARWIWGRLAGSLPGVLYAVTVQENLYLGMHLQGRVMKSAIVLLSGGLDSTTTLAIAKGQGFVLHAMTLRYGQRHEIEIEAARRVANRFGVVEHAVIEIDLRYFGGSALTSGIAVPKRRLISEIGTGIPATYVPARNTIFLSYALAWAEVLPAEDIFIGVNALDYSGYPDCRPEYIEAYERMARLATGRAVCIHAPLVRASKADIVQRGLTLGVDYGETRTCYDPDLEGRACGECDACLLRLRGFAENGLTDPAPYARDRS